jgi:SAM-dependent methyltransferase
MSPLCESFVPAERLSDMEPFYPLHAFACRSCRLVQLEEHVSPSEIFKDYAYFSGYSDSWVAHARRYAAMAIERFGLDGESRVIEVASNDGYLLQHFVAAGIRALGIEPAENIARVARSRGIPTRAEFLSAEVARDIAADVGQADLLVGNNVLAHVPALNDFVAGLKALLKPTGVLTMEFPHLHRLIEENQFDTIYHEHFSYFSFLSAERIFDAHGITVFDVEDLPTHGGSLRIFGRHAEQVERPVTSRVETLRQHEIDLGYADDDAYLGFGARVHETKRHVLGFLIEAKNNGKTVVGYGAPGKGNTFLNYCGISTDFLDYTVDRNPHKQGKYTPGMRLPIYHPDRIKQTRPDYVLILPWNLRDEIVQQLDYIRDWGGKFVTAIPKLRILD